jgi:magnesium transporter
MAQHIEKVGNKAFMPPGSVVPVGGQPEVPQTITRITYSAGQFNIAQDISPDEVRLEPKPDQTTWWRICGFTQAASIIQIGQNNDIHPLILEDIVNTLHRPKLEVFDNYILYMLKHARLDHEDEQASLAQISILQGPGWVVTFEEAPSGIFDPLLYRMEQGRGRLRKMGADYLAYALADVLIDQYHVCLESLASQVDQLEDEIIEDPQSDSLKRLHLLRRKLQSVRSSLRPLREMFSNRDYLETELVSDALSPFIRDLTDHIIQALEICEQLREQITLMMETYLTGLSNRMNQIMQVLTIIATIFIPLTFVAGIYGMNFEFMPELKWRWGYFGAWGIMLAAALAMLWFFKRKKWL